MKLNSPPFLQKGSRSRCRGLSLIEITLVIGLMLALASMVTYSVTSMTDWKKGRSAAEKLKGVYVAQKSYLADHPTKTATDFTSSKLIPYLPGQSGAMPTSESLDGDTLTLDFMTMPPTFQLNGDTYDPSGKFQDGLWDVGKM
jgi:type II secretory pathway pseudopilin PulG